MNRDIIISYIYNDKVSNLSGWTNHKETWGEIVDKLSKYKVLDYTLQEYKENKKEYVSYKDIGSILFGELSGDRRIEENIKYRSMIALDIDECDKSVWNKIDNIKFEHFWHTTHSHTPEEPRIRIYIPLLKRINTKKQYKIITEELSRSLGFEQITEKRWKEIDTASFKYNQVMYLPSIPKDGEFKCKLVEGELLNPFDYLLNKKAQTEQMKKVAKKTLNKLGKEDKIKDLWGLLKDIKSPLDLPKKDVIYKFCSTYDINDIIINYLSDIYEKGTQPNCYTYIEGSSINGLKIYPDNKARDNVYAYSFHNTDPLNDGHCHNGFDMIKIHKFKGNIKDTIKFVKKEMGIDNNEFAIDTKAGHEAHYHFYDDDYKLKLDYNELLDHLENDIEHITFNTKIGFYKYEDQVFKNISKNKITKFIENHLHKNFHGNVVVSEIYNRMLRNERNLIELDVKDNIMTFNNCVLEWDRKGNFERKENTPDYMNTYKFNYDYDDSVKCLKWEKFLNDVLPKDQQLILQEIMGYLMIPDNKAKKFFALHGIGDSGKSLILKTVTKILGEDLVSNITLQKLSNPNLTFETSELYGKLANVVGDLSAAPLNDVSLIKMLTGDDMVNGQKKFHDQFKFYNKARLICSMNTLPPNYNDKSNEFYNRLLIIPFETAIPKEQQDPDLLDKFNIQGIINWCVEGLQRLFKNNLTFSITKMNNDLVQKYKSDNNNVIQFIDDSLMEVPEKERIDKDIATKAGEIYKCYKGFCKENGYSPLGKTKFMNEFKLYKPEIMYSENCKDESGKRFRGFKNIIIKDQAIEEYLRLVF